MIFLYNEQANAHKVGRRFWQIYNKLITIPGTGSPISWMTTRCSTISVPGLLIPVNLHTNTYTSDTRVKEPNMEWHSKNRDFSVHIKATNFVFE